MYLDSNRSFFPWLCNECKDDNDNPTQGLDEVTKCSTNNSGQHHSHNDKPSKVLLGGTEIWHKNGVVHRDGGKVALKCFCIHCTESHAWLEDGEFHRFGGPSLILIGQDQELYSLRGITFNSKEEYEKNLRCKECARENDHSLQVYCTVNKNGKHHSFNDYPSKIIRLDNRESLRWHQDGIHHRLGGASVIFKIGGQLALDRYYLEGKYFGKTKYLATLQNHTRKTIMNRLQRTITQSLRHTNTLESAIKAIVEACCTIGAPFSSGEVARYIRLEKPNIVFAVNQVGKILRNMYVDFDIEYRSGSARWQACRADRYTDNAELVYVYGPTQFTAEHHNFKVSIPAPQKTLQSSLQTLGHSMQGSSTALSYTGKPTKMPQVIFPAPSTSYGNSPPVIGKPATPTQHQRRIVPRMTPTNTSFTLLNERARVHSRERLAVPSTALEKLPTSHGGDLRPGSTVSFVVHNGILKIVAGWRPGWEQKTVQANRGNCGRLYFTSSNLRIPRLTHKDSKTIQFDEQEKELRIVL